MHGQQKPEKARNNSKNFSNPKETNRCTIRRVYIVNQFRIFTKEKLAKESFEKSRPFCMARLCNLSCTSTLHTPSLRPLGVLLYLIPKGQCDGQHGMITLACVNPQSYRVIHGVSPLKKRWDLRHSIALSIRLTPGWLWNPLFFPPRRVVQCRSRSNDHLSHRDRCLRGTEAFLDCWSCPSRDPHTTRTPGVKIRFYDFYGVTVVFLVSNV